MMLQKISRGDVYFYNFGFDYDGSVEGKNRPCVIVSNDKGNHFGTTALVAPITTRSKESCKPWQTHFQNGSKSQIILCEQIKTVNVAKLYNYQGKIDALTMRAVDEAIAIEFDLNVTQREQENTEFLHRVDYALDRIIGKQLTKYEMKINDIISNAIANVDNSKNEYEELCNKVINKVSEIVSNNTSVLDGINDIKRVFNQNATNLDKILSSLINLYKNINESTDTKINMHMDDFVSNDKTEVKNEVKSSRPRYTVEFAKQFIEEYYHGDRQTFLDKHNLHDHVAINNRLTTMKNLLKRNGINWLDIKNKVKVYNINDMSPEEQLNDFGKFIKTNKTLAVTNTLDKKPHEPEEYGLNDTSNYKGGCGQNKGSKQSVRAERFEYTIENCLAFVDECNKNSVEQMCKTYDLTNKQFANRKYLICKWLKEQGVSFKIVKYKRT